MSGPEYRVNKSTGQVVKDDGTGWKPVASVRNKTTGEILIDEGAGWQPMPGAQRNLQADRGMTLAGERANQALASGQKVAPDDLTRLGRPDFSPAAMARLPAPTMSAQEMESWTAERTAAKDRMRLPDDNNKERMISLLNGPTFGNGPRVAAGASTVGALIATPFVEGDIIDQKGISGATSQFLDDARIHQGRGRAERPVESLATEFVPGLFTGNTLIDAGAKTIFKGPGAFNNVAKFMTAGAGYGALYGASQNESGTLGGVGEDAAYGGATGAAFGGILKAAQAPATVAVRATKQSGAVIYDALAGLLGKAGGARDKVADDVAVAAVRRSMERSGLSFQQILDLAKKYEGKPAVLAEILGQDAINALTSLTRRPGTTPQKAQSIIEERFGGFVDRAQGDLEKATGFKRGDIEGERDAAIAARQAAAAPVYQEAFSQFPKVASDRLEQLGTTSPTLKSYLGQAQKKLADKAAVEGKPIDQMSELDFWDLVKRTLDDDLNDAVARKQIDEVRNLSGIKEAFVSELDTLTGGAYAAAREIGGEAPRLQAAFKQGGEALGSKPASEIQKQVNALNPQDAPFYKAGMTANIADRLDKGMGPNRFGVRDTQNKLRAGLGEEEGGSFLNAMDAEASLRQTGARWAPRMNSVTGTVLENGPSQLGDDLMAAATAAARGDKIGLITQAVNFMRRRGFNQKQIDAMGDLLLSDPMEGLKQLGVQLPKGFTPGSAGAASIGQGFEPASRQPANALSGVRSNGFSIPTSVGDAVVSGAVGSGTGSVMGMQYDLNGDGKIDDTDKMIGAAGGMALFMGGPRAYGAAKNALSDVSQAGFGFGKKAGNALAGDVAPTAPVPVDPKLLAAAKDHPNDVGGYRPDGTPVFYPGSEGARKANQFNPDPTKAWDAELRDMGIDPNALRNGDITLESISPNMRPRVEEIWQKMVEAPYDPNAGTFKQADIVASAEPYARAYMAKGGKNVTELERQGYEVFRQARRLTQEFGGKGPDPEITPAGFGAGGKKPPKPDSPEVSAQYYHGTDKEFDAFDLDQAVRYGGPDSALGIHIGNRPQAQAMVTRAGQGKIIPVNTDAQNFLEMPDLNTWRAASVIANLKARGIDVPDTVKTNADVREYLKAQGYDGIRYKNTAEADGESLIVFDPAKLQLADRATQAPARSPRKPKPDSPEAIAAAVKGIATKKTPEPTRLERMVEEGKNASVPPINTLPREADALGAQAERMAARGLSPIEIYDQTGVAMIPYNGGSVPIVSPAMGPEELTRKFYGWLAQPPAKRPDWVKDIISKAPRKKGLMLTEKAPAPVQTNALAEQPLPKAGFPYGGVAVGTLAGAATGIPAGALAGYAMTRDQNRPRNALSGQ